MKCVRLKYTSLIHNVLAPFSLYLLYTQMIIANTIDQTVLSVQSFLVWILQQSILF